jgi:hypothetical protein
MLDRSTNRSARAMRRIIGFLVISFAAVAGAACSKDKGKTSEAGAAAASPSAATAPGLPAHVDAKLYNSLREISQTCDVNVEKSQIRCQDRKLDALQEQFNTGARSPSRSLDTMAHALKQSDPKLMTVAAVLLERAFSTPLDEKDRKRSSKATALSLLDSLKKLPGNQAAQAVTPIVYAALEVGAEQELYAAVDGHSYARLGGRAYRHLMAAGRMRTWGKVMELVKSDRLEVVSASLEAPNLMRDKAVSEKQQICDWYKSLLKDPRHLVTSRASGYLIVCGPSYIEQLLVADEALFKDPTVTQLKLHYGDMCEKGLLASSGPTPEQCVRLRQLLVGIIAAERMEVRTRASAIQLLTGNFPDQESLALLKRFATHKLPMVQETAARAVATVQHILEATKRVQHVQAAGAE